LLGFLTVREVRRTLKGELFELGKKAEVEIKDS
jgi:hypothetical protein